MSYLKQIVEYKREENDSLMRKVSLADVRAQAADQDACRDFFQGVTVSQSCSIIAEVKKASPSKGVIVADFDPVRIAKAYEEDGAAALSVLTDEHFFQGHLYDIKDIKGAVALPILRKDFTLHEYHIYEARAGQADAILLIARILDAGQLHEYRVLACELGLTPLIEVHDKEDLEKVLRDQEETSFARSLIGINNRNLETFEVDLRMTEELKQLIPDTFSVVSESGLQTRADIERLLKVGVSIFLIGEALLAADDPGEKLCQLMGKGL